MTEASRNEEANRLTRRAIGRMAEGAWAEALPDLDEAIRLRADLSLDREPVYLWGFAAGWINRGDVLVALGRTEEALASYDEGLRQLEGLEDSPSVRNRRAIAWSNRGLALEQTGNREEALRCFDEALVAMGRPEDDTLRLTGAAARLHRCRLRDEDPIAEAEAVLEQVRPLERSSSAAAELGLKARHLLCRRRCIDLEEGRIDGDWIAGTTDLLEEGLELERCWSGRGARELRSLAAELFELGLRVYRVCQPRFLAEFILETMDPERSPGAPVDDSDFQAAAVRAIGEAMRDAVNRGVTNALQSADREQAILGQLREVDRWLAEPP